MDEKLLVSIIINNYNYDRFLAEAIDSAIAQTYARIEVIVVDDGSTDKSREIIAGYGERLTPILQVNGKQAAALNSGFAASHGEIVLFLDSDDYLLPTAIERIVAAFGPGVAKVHYRLQVVDIDSKPSGAFIPTTTMKLSTGEVWRQLVATSGYVSTCMSGNVYHRSTFAHVIPININNRVRLTKLDTFIKEQYIENCHLIKIDVEGAEVMFLRGAISFLSKHRPIIYGEFNNYFLPRFGCSFLDVVTIFKPLEYRFFQQTSKGDFIEVVHPEADSENMLLTPVEISDSVLTKLGVL